MRAPGSLRRKLFWRLLILVLVVGLSMAAVTTAITARTLERQADRNLQAATLALFQLTREEWAAKDAPSAGEPIPLSREDVSAFAAIADTRAFAVVIDGRVAYQSSPVVSDWGLSRRSGLETVSADGRAWRVSRRQAADRGWLVMVGEPLADRRVVIVIAGLQTLLPLVAMAIGAAALLLATLHHGLSDLRRLEAGLATRSPHDLSALADEPWPPELQGVVTTLNRLFRRVRTAFRIEQKLSNIAAHQLRTPLAAMKLQAQMLSREPSPSPSRLAELQGMIERASNRIEQLLRLSRAEASFYNARSVDLVSLCGDLLADIALLAAEADVELALDAPAALVVETDEDILRLALEPLIENALNHGRDGGVLEIRLSGDPHWVSLMVLDRGSMPIAHERTLTEDGRPGPNGGLGLMIAAAATRALGGTVRIGPRPTGHGTVATVTLGDRQGSTNRQDRQARGEREMAKSRQTI